MRMLILRAIVLIGVLAAGMLAKQQLNNEAIIKLHNAGLGDDMILNMVNTQAGQYALGVDDVVALKRAGAKVIVSLVWGDGPGGHQTVPVPAVTTSYAKFQLKFTAGADTDAGRLEISATGQGLLHIGAVSLMPADNIHGFRADTIALLKAQRSGMWRFPGGNYLSAFEWRDAIGDPDKRAPRPDPVRGGFQPNDVGTDEFMTLMGLLDVDPFISVNSGFGDAFSAAQLVEYANGAATTPMGGLRAANGHPAPYNIKWWGIGNEMYGPWQYGHMSLDQYWVKYNNVVDAMKAVDPKIKVVLGGASVCEKSVGGAEKKGNFFPSIWEPPITAKLPFEFYSLDDWDYYLLANCADNVDFLSEHTYAYPDLIYDAEKQSFADVKDPLQFRARRIANRIGGFFDAWDKYVEKIPSLKNKDIKFIFDEWGNRNRSMAGNGGPSGGGGFGRSVGMLTPLSYALLLHELFRHSDTVYASCATGGLRVLTDSTGEGVGMSPEGVVFKLLQTHFLNALPVAVDGNSPQPLMPGTAYVDRGIKPTGSPTYPLDVLAAYSSDRKKFLISVVNPTEATSAFAPKIGGVNLRAQGKLYQIAPPSFDSTNEAGKEPAVKIVETAQNGVPATVQVPPVSVSLYEFEIA